MQDDRRRYLALKEQLDFLGYEFLTWTFLLIAKTPDEAVALLSSTQKDIEVSLGSKIITTRLNHKEQKTSVVTPLLHESQEVFASIRNGHVVETMSFVMRNDETIYSWIVNAHDFSITQVKIKNNFDDDAQANNEQEEGLSFEDQVREQLFLRTKSLDVIDGIVDTLFSQFMKRRLQQSDYLSEMASMRAHVGEIITFPKNN